MIRPITATPLTIRGADRLNAALSSARPEYPMTLLGANEFASRSRITEDLTLPSDTLEERVAYPHNAFIEHSAESHAGSTWQSEIATVIPTVLKVCLVIGMWKETFRRSCTT